MIRVFVKTDETMPEHELVVRKSYASINQLMYDLELSEAEFIQIKSRHMETEENYIRISAIKFIRVTEDKENE